MKITVPSFLILVSITLLSGCDNDPPVSAENSYLNIPGYLSDHNENESQSKVFAFTYGDSASIRHGRKPEHIRGFLPLLDNGEELLEVSVFKTDAETYLSEPENDSVFQFIGTAETENGMFALSMDQFETNTYLKSVIVTSDSVYFSTPAAAVLATKQTDYISPEKVDTVHDELGRPVFDYELNNTEKAVFEIYNRSGEHKLSLYTDEHQVTFFSQFDFSGSSRPDLNNPGVTAGNYRVNLFFINEKNRARLRTRFQNVVIQ